jgi:hypothetical protein
LAGCSLFISLPIWQEGKDSVDSNLLVKFYADSVGRIGQANGDKGDSAQRTASFIVLQRALGRPDSMPVSDVQLINYYEVAAGRFVRYPTGKEGDRYKPWYGEPDNFTRDQSVVLQAAMIMAGAKEAFKRLWKARARRLLLHFNTVSYDDQEPVRKKFPDIPNLVEIGQIIRGFNLWGLWPVLCITDLQNLIDVLGARKLQPYDSDNMLLPVLIDNNTNLATPISWLTKKIYRLTDARERLLAYHAEGPGKNGNAELGKLYVEAFERCL